MPRASAITPPSPREASRPVCQIMPNPANTRPRLVLAGDYGLQQRVAGDHAGGGADAVQTASAARPVGERRGGGLPPPLPCAVNRIEPARPPMGSVSPRGYLSGRSAADCTPG